MAPRDSAIHSGELAHFDYRHNLIVDQDNPILVMKAWRDRLPSGHAYLGRPDSEDALTWNVFRSLEIAGLEGYDLTARFFGISSVERMLIWGCDLEHHGEEQQLLNVLIRGMEARHGGTMTEPDLVLVGREEVLFVECKLNQAGAGSPWRSRGEGAARRWTTYSERLPRLAQVSEWRPLYQLLRNYVYAVEMARYLGKCPRVTSLLNERHSERLDLVGTYYEPFRQFDPAVCDPIHTWQRLLVTLSASDLSEPVRVPIVDKLSLTLQGE